MRWLRPWPPARFQRRGPTLPGGSILSLLARRRRRHAQREGSGHLLRAAGTGKTYVAQALGGARRAHRRILAARPVPSRLQLRGLLRGLPARAGEDGRAAHVRSCATARCGRSPRRRENAPDRPYVLSSTRSTAATSPKIFGELLLPARVPRARDQAAVLAGRASSRCREPLLHRHDEHRRSLDRARGQRAPPPLLLRRRSCRRGAGQGRPRARGLRRHGLDDEPARLLDELNRSGRSRRGRGVRDRPVVLHDRDGGAPDLDRVWAHAILPLLEERFYGALGRREVAAEFGLEAVSGEPGRRSPRRRRGRRGRSSSSSRRPSLTVDRRPLRAWTPATRVLTPAHAAELPRCGRALFAVGAETAAGSGGSSPTRGSACSSATAGSSGSEPRLEPPSCSSCSPTLDDPKGLARSRSPASSEADDVRRAPLPRASRIHAERALHRGLLRGYVHVEERRHDLRGRIRFADQLARAPRRCRYRSRSPTTTTSSTSSRTGSSGPRPRCSCASPPSGTCRANRLIRIRALLEDVALVREPREALGAADHASERAVRAGACASPSSILRATSLEPQAGRISSATSSST